tara:strand:+ start:191 stop:346 length:156 start_codon:yes stop_codon:yes gene_type:complete
MIYFVKVNKSNKSKSIKLYIEEYFNIIKSESCSEEDDRYDPFDYDTLSDLI